LPTVKEKYGFLPKSVMTFENVPKRWREIDSYLTIDMCKRSSSSKYLPGLKYSKFSYGLSSFVIKYWSKKRDIILDPFMGWGIRGAVAIELERTYIGYDISPRMFSIASSFLDKVKSRSTLLTSSTGDYILYNADGCKLEHSANSSVDLVFTCPPYWNLEKYESVEGQLSDCKTYDEYLVRIDEALSNCYRVLKPGKFCIFVVADFRKEGFRILHKDTIELAAKNSFTPWDIVISVLRSPFVWTQISKCDRMKYTSKAHEYILVFKKE